MDSKVLFLGGRPHGKGGWLGNESGAEKYILFPCKAEVEELMDVNGHGVTLFFCRGKNGLNFVTVHGFHQRIGFLIKSDVLRRILPNAAPRI